MPVPFELVYACKVKNPEEVEKALHLAFSPHRINPKREFFKIEPEQVIAILKLLHTEDATLAVEQQPTNLDKESLVAAEQLKAKRPNMNFLEMGIPIGAELHYTQGSATVKVISPKRVLLNEQEMSLTGATRQLLGIDYSVQPSPYWLFQGRRLKEIYEETYEGID